MAISQFWYGALVALAGWQFIQIPVAMLLYGRKTEIDMATIGTTMVLGSVFLAIAFAVKAGVL